MVYELVYSNGSTNGSIRAKVTNDSSDQASSSSPKRSVFTLPAAILRQALMPLSNFGFGKRSVWEGGVGLFVLSGALILAVTLVWAKGKQIRARTRRYEAVFEFQQAQGITVGTPVRIRGVDVGQVVQVSSWSLLFNVSIMCLSSIDHAIALSTLRCVHFSTAIPSICPRSVRSFPIYHAFCSLN